MKKINNKYFNYNKLQYTLKLKRYLKLTFITGGNCTKTLVQEHTYDRYENPRKFDDKETIIYRFSVGRRTHIRQNFINSI